MLIQRIFHACWRKCCRGPPPCPILAKFRWVISDELLPPLNLTKFCELRRTTLLVWHEGGQIASNNNHRANYIPFGWLTLLRSTPFTTVTWCCCTYATMYRSSLQSVFVLHFLQRFSLLGDVSGPINLENNARGLFPLKTGSSSAGKHGDYGRLQFILWPRYVCLGGRFQIFWRLFCDKVSNHEVLQ